MRSPSPIAPAYLHELGLICPLGWGKAEVSARLASAERAVPAPVPWLDTPLPALAVAAELPPVPGHLADYDCRNNRLLLAALGEIEPALSALRRGIAPERIGVVIGTSTSGIAEGERALAERKRSGHMPIGYHYKQQELGAAAEFLARLLDLRGPAYAVSATCASGAHALASARRLLRLGLCDLVLAGGADALCRTTLEGFAALEALSPGGCNPFSRNRDGIAVGEGAALFLVSREPAPIALLGVGIGADAHHISAPRPDGAGARAAMRAALDDAGLVPAQVDYLNLHGTGTRQNDAMESRAVHALFGDATPCSSTKGVTGHCGDATPCSSTKGVTGHCGDATPCSSTKGVTGHCGDATPCSSTKGVTGHCLGAAGAIEAGLCWLLLADPNSPPRLPPHRWDGQPDPELPPLAWARPEMPIEKSLQYCLSNSYAFGGNNVSLLLGRP